MKKRIVDYIKEDKTIEGPFVLVRENCIPHCPFWEVRGKKGNQPGNWYVTFNGNSKQRRQQQRKLLRDLNN